MSRQQLANSHGVRSDCLGATISESDWESVELPRWGHHRERLRRPAVGGGEALFRIAIRRTCRAVAMAGLCAAARLPAP